MSKALTVPHGNEKYPWEQWENGEEHTAIKGEDFTISAKSFRNSLTARAAKIGRKVATSVRSKAVVIFRFLTEVAAADLATEKSRPHGKGSRGRARKQQERGLR